VRQPAHASGSGARQVLLQRQVEALSESRYAEQAATIAHIQSLKAHARDLSKCGPRPPRPRPRRAGKRVGRHEAG